ncbi:MAG: DUF4127 family protein [Clostridia bacterium]|nr:DUF4127 family protein [Clostridia bacterium]
MKVLFLPVDSRPCSWLFPKQLLEWCGVECILPQMEVLDHFTRPSDWHGIQEFLTAHAAEADVWAISLDQLCFGSLLASRELDMTEQEALDRLAWFEQLRAQYPDKPVHAVNTIMRTSVSALSLADMHVYHAMMEYSYWSDKSVVTGSLEDMARAERAARRIPMDTILKYHEVRQRNHRINSKGVELARKGVFNSLLLLMEDSEEYGFHRTEQRILQEQIGGAPHIMIQNGTDEGPLLVMKCLMKQTLPVAVEWVGREDGQFIARYEDRPFVENVESVFRYIGIEEAPDAPVTLAIAANTAGAQIDTTMVTTMPAYPQDEERAALRINELLSEGRTVYLLDLFCCNGGWPDFIKRIEHPERLAGYSAWNTATNALGTLVGQICSDAIADRRNVNFRNERFLDDLLYENCIRSQLTLTLKAEGQDPYHLTDKKKADLLLQEFFRQLFARQGGWTRRFSNVLDILPKTYRVSLPWERTFEVEARFTP